MLASARHSWTEWQRCVDLLSHQRGRVSRPSSSLHAQLQAVWGSWTRRSRLKARLESIRHERKFPVLMMLTRERGNAGGPPTSTNQNGRRRIYFSICERACLRGDRSQLDRSSAQSPSEDAAARSRIAPAPTDRTRDSARARALPPHRLSLCRRDGAPMMRSALTLNRTQLCAVNRTQLCAVTRISAPPHAPGVACFSRLRSELLLVSQDSHTSADASENVPTSSMLRCEAWERASRSSCIPTFQSAGKAITVQRPATCWTRAIASCRAAARRKDMGSRMRLRASTQSELVTLLSWHLHHCPRLL
jgi:hypothetical protein